LTDLLSVCAKLGCFGGLLKYNIIVIGFVLRKKQKVYIF